MKKLTKEQRGRQIRAAGANRGDEIARSGILELSDAKPTTSGGRSYIDWVREICLSRPYASEDIQWGSDLLFRVAKKIFCSVPLEPAAPVRLSLKCTPEKFAELVEMEGIIPAPYMARNQWIAFVDMNALRQTEIKDLILNSYQLVFQKLPKRTQEELSREKSGNKKENLRKK